MPPQPSFELAAKSIFKQNGRSSR